MGITVYTSASCTPCQEIQRLLNEQKAQHPDVEIVDIETDAGFDRFAAEVLSKGDGAVPSAYRDGKRCAILVDDESKAVAFDCDNPDATPDQLSGQPG